MCCRKELKNNPSLGKAEGCLFYLHKITTNVIIKAIFMIVKLTNPKKSKYVIIKKEKPIIHTTSNLTEYPWKIKVATPSTLSHLLKNILQ